MPVCRYGHTWADWRHVSFSTGDRTESLTLEEGEWVTALTGQSSDSGGWTVYLSVTTSTSRRWQQGHQEENSDFSVRPCPALGGAALPPVRQTDRQRLGPLLPLDLRLRGGRWMADWDLATGVL